MALRASAPIFVAQQVLDQAKVAFASQGEAVQPPSQQGEGESAGEGVEGESSSSDFQAIDKAKWEEILSQLDPDDFKYKM
jgi:bifunctional DNase/RNase